MKVCQQAADKSAGEGIAATFGILAGNGTFGKVEHNNHHLT